MELVADSVPYGLLLRWLQGDDDLMLLPSPPALKRSAMSLQDLILAAEHEELLAERQLRIQHQEEQQRRNNAAAALRPEVQLMDPPPRRQPPAPSPVRTSPRARAGRGAAGRSPRAEAGQTALKRPRHTAA